MTPSTAPKTLTAAAKALATGATSSRALVEAALEAIAAEPSAFTFVDADGAREQADAADAARRAGRAASPFAGAPVSIKDLFDVKGQETRAGSELLRGRGPARRDAPAVARLRRAGLVLIGRTHMSEFAFTGLGLNPHLPPLSHPYQADRAPGGSSSGAAVSVARNQALAALGTDTGGSVRIPAAFCGLVGFKPTQARLSRAGTTPLSPRLDSIGPIARTVRCCRILDGLIRRERGPRPLPAGTLKGLVLGLPDSHLLRDLEPDVEASLEEAVRRLRDVGVVVQSFAFPEIDALPQLLARGAIANVEAFVWHRRQGHLAEGRRLDPHVLARLERGGEMSAADFLDLLAARRRMIQAARRRTRPFSAVVFPTTAIQAPRTRDLASAEGFARLNAAALRNPSVVNFLGGCAVTLPVRPFEQDGSWRAGLGLTLMSGSGADEALLALAEAVEPGLR